jgi:chorismate dehydratase
LKPPRIGCVKYLNARPLIRGWAGDVDFDHPSALCRKLAEGELDIALASSFEYLRNPVYRIVDDVSISSAGAVYSVVVAHTGHISEIDEIELDPASETSVNLLRCLLAELRQTPRLIQNMDLQSVRPAELRPAELNGPHRARLLIGDQAIRFRQRHAGEFHFWDLGEQWNKLVGLPFVYALWLIRPEVRDSKPLAERLRKLRDENLADIDKLAAQEKEFDRDFCRRYYGENLRFSFGEKEKAGLREFNRRCREQRLLPLGQLDAEFSAVDFSLRCV